MFFILFGVTVALGLRCGGSGDAMVKVQVRELEDRIVLAVEGRLTGGICFGGAKRVEHGACPPAWLQSAGRLEACHVRGS